MGATGRVSVSPRKTFVSNLLLFNSFPVFRKKGKRSSPTAIDMSSIVSSQVSLRSASFRQRSPCTHRQRGYQVVP